MIDQPDWTAVARVCHLSRQMDTLEVQHLTPEGKVAYQFSAAGHELTQALLAQALDHRHDAATVYYRSRPFMLACGLTAVEALRAGMARSGGLTDGRDVGVMYNRPQSHQRGLGTEPSEASGPPAVGGEVAAPGALTAGRELTVLPTSGDVGAQYTPAAGWAQAIEYRQRVMGQSEWHGALAVAMGGEGSAAANGFWAALNIVTVQHLPMLFFIEDNLYGLSVPSALQTPGGNIAANLADYGNLLTLEVDGCDPACTWDTIREAVRHVRAANGPCLLRLRVPRLLGHTFVDDQAYKPAEVRADDASRDPIPCLRDYLIDHATLDAGQWSQLEQDVASELDSALTAAESSPEPDPGTATGHRYYEGLAPRQGGLRPEAALPAMGRAEPRSDGPRINLIDAVRRTLESEMAANERIAVFGEDVGVKGGVHGATRDMQGHFGADRVFDTSLNEEGIVGRALGMALAGLLPVPEIQFRKYADPAHEQLTDIGWLRWRTANRFAAPMVVRIPVGYGKKTGDPWHSVSAEAAYAHLIGWRIAYPSNAEDAAGLLRSALRGDDPTFFLEHRALLDSRDARRPYPGDDYCLPFGQAAAVADGTDLTVVTWGAMVERCRAAADALGGRVALLDLRTIAPWDKTAVMDSVKRTGRALIVHEDTLTAGFGAEIAATIVGEAFTDLDAPVERLAVPDVPVPYNATLMAAVVPTVDAIARRMAALLEY